MHVDIEPTAEATRSLADLLARLGGVPLDRIRFRPAPGTAPEADLIAQHDRQNRLFERVAGGLFHRRRIG